MEEFEKQLIHQPTQSDFNLDEILEKVPSEENRRELILKAVEDNLTQDPKYINQAIDYFEKQGNYVSAASLARQYGDTDRALAIYGRAAKLGNFDRLVYNKIGPGAVFKEIGRKIGVGARESLKFIASTYFSPTSCRKHIDYASLSLLGMLGALMTEIGVAFSPYIQNKELQKTALVLFFARLSTNLASGLYEWYRYERRELQEKARIESGLEKKLIE